MEAILAFMVTVVVGLLVGLLSGLLGIGGGLVLVPAFKLCFALEAIAATATSLFTIIPTSIAGAVTRIREKTCVPKLGVAAGVGGAVTSPVGVWVASISPGWLIMLVAAIVIGYSAFKMLRKALGMKSTFAVGTAGAAGESAAGPDSFPEVDRKRMCQAFAMGMVAGVASGYIGIGGGFLMVPLLVSILGMSMRYASGTSLIAIMILAIPGVIYQGWLGNVSWALGVAMACGAVPGAALGARLASHVPERMLRFVFGVMLLVAAALLVLDEAGLLG